MKTHFCNRRTLIRCTLALLVWLNGAAASADPELVVPPMPLPGPYPVACSNVAQDFSRLVQGESAQSYWDGAPRGDSSPRYITDLLADPGSTLSASVTAPGDSELFGSFAGQTYLYVILVCYPTSAANSRADYPLPSGKSVPHMQRGSEAPLLADAAAHYPFLLFSTGLKGSPLGDDYIEGIQTLASNGYVVAAPFHGDPRFSSFDIANVGDVINLVAHFRDFTGMQALRPLSLSATLDVLLANPQWRDHIDAARVGGFGPSLGAESLLLMAGGGLTTSIGFSWKKTGTDVRLKAAVGYVPYFGQPIFPAFGRDEHGLDDVTLPFLAISGTADTTAPLVQTIQGMNHLAGPRELVTLNGVTHGFDVPSTNDIFTWALTFLDAYVKGVPAARETLPRMASVAGGGEDSVRIQFNGNLASNFDGLWWNAPAASESGWGINLAHQGDVIFATWFTYDIGGDPWWLSMTATKIATGTYSGTLYRSHGPAFDAVPFDPGVVVLTPVGAGTLTFDADDHGTFVYTVNAITQTKTITRQVFGPLPVCTFGAQPDLTLATNYQDLWWNAPPGSESGWGLNLVQQGSTMFATWFTYDHGGAPMWLSATLTPSGASGYVGALYRSTGPAFSAAPFDPANVSRTPVGTATVTFANGNSASFAYVLGGVMQTKDITREVFRAPGTVCQ
ncbi:MAG: hypothetical protein ABI537_02670 [Casimicrobiaceae bacterium]